MTNGSVVGRPSSVVLRSLSFVFRPSSFVAIVAVLAFVQIGSSNLDRYFNKQMNDHRCGWNERGEQSGGADAGELRPQLSGLVSPLRTDVPATLYLAPGKTRRYGPARSSCPLLKSETSPS